MRKRKNALISLSLLFGIVLGFSALADSAKQSGTTINIVQAQPVSEEQLQPNTYDYNDNYDNTGIQQHLTATNNPDDCLPGQECMY